MGNSSTLRNSLVKPYLIVEEHRPAIDKSFDTNCSASAVGGDGGGGGGGGVGSITLTGHWRGGRNRCGGDKVQSVLFALCARVSVRACASKM